MEEKIDDLKSSEKVEEKRCIYCGSDDTYIKNDYISITYCNTCKKDFLTNYYKYYL